MDRIEKSYLLTHLLYDFSYLKEDEIFANYINLLKTVAKNNDIEENIKNYCNFVFKLKNNDFGEYLKNIILKKGKYSEKELIILEKIACHNSNTIKEILNKNFSNYTDIINDLKDFSMVLPKISQNDFETSKNKDNISLNRAFIFDNDFDLKPIDYCENTNFNSLKGYKEQQRILFDNTSALLKGLKVNNILLYGDAGCGKSTSVRALLNEFDEIKIVQIFKNNLINLDKLFLKLKDLPHKFIIFADDISFDDTDETFSTMKAMIEGSLIQCPDNATIYATSNRRHLTKETFQSRSGDEIHLNDTINEINSLSERFGISLLFSKPSNDEFNKIVIELARDNNINLDEKTLIEKAQRLALIKGSKSPRIAKQLVDNLVAHINI